MSGERGDQTSWSSVADFNQVCGRAEDHLIDWTDNCRVHVAVAPSLAELVHGAAAAGFQLQVASGFRSFARQLAIWNGKARGERPVFDSEGRAIDMARLDEREQMLAILRWSALPGTSRHHWGTDVDVWDAAAVTADYRLQLNVEECGEGGPFCALHQWLDVHIVRGATPFFRPYGVDRGGIAPEPWHLSHRPLAREFQRLLAPELVASVLGAVDIALKDVVIASLDEIFDRFVRVPD